MGNTCCDNAENVKKDNKQYNPAEQAPALLPSRQLSQPPADPLVQLLSDLHRQVTSNQAYHRLLSREYVLEWLDRPNRAYLTQQQLGLLLTVALDYLKASQEHARRQGPVEANAYEERVKSWAEAVGRVETESVLFNKDALQLLDYLGQPGKSSLHQHCFLDLKFDLSREEVGEVAAVVRGMCRTDSRAFCFLTNYLVLSCLRMEQQSTGLKVIEEAYLGALEQLCKEYPPFRQTETNQELLNHHPNWKSHEELSLPKIDLENVDAFDKDPRFEAFILEQADKAKEAFETLQQTVRPVLAKHGGVRYEQALRVTRREDDKALLKVKQELLPSSYQATTLGAYVEEASKSGKRATLEGLLGYEHSHFKDIMGETFHKVRGPVEFGLRDMLWARCLFAGVDKINSCVDGIREAVATREGISVVEVENQLVGEGCSGSVVVRVQVGEALAEICLVNEHQGYCAYFSRELEWLHGGSARFFTPFTALHNLNQRLSVPFFAHLQQAIAKAGKSQAVPADKLATLAQKLGRLSELTHLKVDGRASQLLRYDFLLESKARQLASIREEGVEAREEGEGDERLRFWDDQVYDVARKRTQKLAASLERIIGSGGEKGSSEARGGQKEEYQREIEAIGQYFSRFGGERDRYLTQYLNWVGKMHEKKQPHVALRAYQEIERILGQPEGRQVEELLKTLHRRAHLCNQLKDHAQAIATYERVLELQGRSLGKDSAECFLTLKSIGATHHQDKDFPQAERFFEKSLEGLERTRGRDSWEVGSLLASLAATKSGQSKFKEAHECLGRSAQIQERVRGRESLEVAGTLKNIGMLYHNQGQPERALGYLQQSIGIRERIRGRDSAESAEVLGVVGFILAAQNKHEEAVRSYQECLRIREKARGRSAKDSATVLRNLSVSCAALGRQGEAESFRQQSEVAASKLKQRGSQKG